LKRAGARRKGGSARGFDTRVMTLSAAHFGLITLSHSEKDASSHRGARWFKQREVSLEQIRIV